MQGRPGRYQLSADDLKVLTRELIDLHPLSVSAEEHSLVCYHVDSGSRLADIGRHVEREVFEDKFGNDTAEMEREYNLYDQPGAASFFIVVDRVNEEAAGVLRMVQNGANGFKTLNDLADSDRANRTITPAEVFSYYGIKDPNTCWDAATLAVRKEYRGKNYQDRGKYIGIMRYLTRSAYLYGMENDFHHVFMIMDRRVRQQSIKFLGIPYRPLAGLGKISYLGSEESYPMYCYYPEFLDKMRGMRMLTPHRMLARKAIQGLKDDSDDAFMRVGADNCR